jgi:hypothetical protein
MSDVMVVSMMAALRGILLEGIGESRFPASRPIGGVLRLYLRLFETEILYTKSGRWAAIAVRGPFVRFFLRRDESD